MRTLLALVRLTTLLAPLVILTYWGGSYLDACIRFLANPRMAVEFQYRAEGKQAVIVSASSYFVGLGEEDLGEVMVVRPRAVNVAGDVLFYADRARAIGLPMFFGEAKRAVVEVRNAFGTIIRKPSGDLDIFDYLPERKGPSGNYPFVVNVNRAKLKLIESTSKRRFVQHASIEDLNVDGVGDRWIASGRATLEDVGNLWVSVQNQPTSGVWIRGESNQLEVAELFRVFRQTKEGVKRPNLKDFEFGSLVVYGPFELFVPANRSARLYSEVNASARKFRYRSDYYAENARFSGVASASGIQGTVVASSPGLDAAFRGAAAWEGGFRMDGNLSAKAATVASIPRPLRAQLPRDLDIRGPIEFKGRLAYDAKGGVRANGIANATQVTMFQEAIGRPQLLIDYDPRGYRFAAQAGVWRGAPLTGSIALDRATKKLSGSLKVTRLNLEGLASRLKIRDLGGTGDLDVLIDGTLDKPIAHIRASTQHRFARTTGMMRQPGIARLAATLDGNRLKFEQAFVVSPAGSIAATGYFDLKSKYLNMVATGSGVDLQVLNPELSGIGRFKGSVVGNLDQIRYKGTAELFGTKVGGQAIPVITGNLEGDSKSLTASNLRAVKGAGEASGKVRLRFKDMALDGNFQAAGVQLSDFLGEDYLASIDLTNARLTGTFRKPMFNAVGRASDIVILGSRIDGADAVVTYEGEVLKVDDFSAKIGDGSVTGYLQYTPKRKAGEANFIAKDIAIEHFIRPEMAATISGLFSGSGLLRFDGSGFREGSGDGLIENIVLNETKLGGGEWKVSAEGRSLSGTLFFGGIGPSMDVVLNKYGIESRELDADLWVRNLPVSDVHKIVEQYLPKWDERILALLHDAKGTIGVSGALTGTIDNPNVARGGVTAEDLTIGGRKAGNFDTKFSKVGGIWTFDNIDWSGGPVALKAKGAFEERGLLEFEGNVENLDLSYISIFEPAFANLVGRLDSTVFVSGTTQNPVVEASLSTDSANSYLQYANSKNDEERKKLLEEGLTYGGIAFLRKDQGPSPPIKVAFNKLTVTNWSEGLGGIVSDYGRMEQAGYAGTLAFKLPFRFPSEFVKDAPVSARLELDQREVKDIDQLARVFDPKESRGTVRGIVNVTGTTDDLTATGDLSLIAEKLVLQSGGQAFNNVEAGIQILPRRFNANLQATSATGGVLGANAHANIPTVNDILLLFRENQLERIFRSPMAGTVTAEDLSVRTSFLNEGRASAVVTTHLELSGTVKEPQVKGTVDLPRAYLRMPTEIPTSAEKRELAIDPYFDLQVRTSAATFENTTANIEMAGSGTINGTLQELDSYALLRLSKGVLRLPTSRITLEPGGVVRPYYAINQGITDARLDLEIEGNTRAVGPSKIGQGAQRYDIHLDIRGDLLQEGGLTLNATSSPSDLTQEEIFALIGRIDLIEGLASGVQSGSPEADIRNAIYGLTPYYLDPYTSKLAAMFGLDYITPEINTIDGVSILFAKTLGRNLVLSGSRQVTQVNQNYPIKYDLNLAYTLRFGNRSDRRRLNFIVGTSEMRPWRIAIEYTFRF